MSSPPRPNKNFRSSVHAGGGQWTGKSGSGSKRRAGWLIALTVAVLALVAVTVAVRQTDDQTASGQRVLLDESFDSGPLDTNVWNTCHWWDDDGCTIASNDELEWYRPEQVTVADGALRLTATPDPYRAPDGRTYDYRSGMVTTGPTPDGPAKLAFTYGTVEARVRIPEGRGLWPAIWLLPADRESRPEIDLLEVIGQDPGQLILHFHPEDRDADSPSHRIRVPEGALADGWHTVGITWSRHRLVYLLDGKQIWTVTGSQVPDEPMYLIMNLAVGGAYPGPPDRTTSFPATFQIDHVRITTGS